MRGLNGDLPVAGVSNQGMKEQDLPMPDPDGRSFPTWSFCFVGTAALILALALPTGAAILGVIHAEPSQKVSQGGPLRPRLIWLPGGTVLMGSPKGMGDWDEQPQRAVTVSSFAMCETEVTVAQYLAVTGVAPSDCDFGCDDDAPVQNVNWQDAILYLNMLTRLENRGRAAEQAKPQLMECYDEQTWTWNHACTGYRLPTEAEWEYAARAGSTTAYSFGDNAQEICKYGHVKSCEENDKVVLVKAGRANAWGFYGVHGNVWEWVFDTYDSGAVTRSNAMAPNNDSDIQGNPENNVSRVRRGGSFVSSAAFARSAVRTGEWPWSRFRYIGFRCALGSRS